MKSQLGPWDNMEGKLRELGGVCSALWATRNFEEEIYDDLMAYHAPSECFPLAFSGMEKIRADIAAKWGWDLVVLKRELEHRVDARWLYMTGMTDLCAVPERRPRCR